MGTTRAKDILRITHSRRISGVKKQYNPLEYLNELKEYKRGTSKEIHQVYSQTISRKNDSKNSFNYGFIKSANKICVGGYRHVLLTYIYVKKFFNVLS